MTRELDAAVAEKVMGWIDVEELTKDEDGRDGWIGIAPGDEGMSRLGASPFQDVPNYRTDISTAWSVVKRMKELGWVVRIGQFDNTERWNCRFVPVTEPWEWEFATEDTVEDAICNAALAALEVRS